MSIQVDPHKNPTICAKIFNKNLTKPICKTQKYHEAIQNGKSNAIVTKW